MTAVEPAALKHLLRAIATGSRGDRLALAGLRGGVRESLSDTLEGSTRLLSGATETFRAQASLAALLRLLWSLVPARLLETQSPDIRALARKAIVERFGEFEGSEEVIRHLTTVFKRVRRFNYSGRIATSLDLDLVAHQELFEQQQGRCNHCRYQFDLAYYLYAAEEEGIPSTPYAPKEGEVYLSTTYRRPELDHIVPVLLGGDSIENWQILCRSCNAGKSDQISYFFSLAGPGSNRLSHLLELTPAKRYAVIAEAVAKEKDTNSLAGDGKFYRVFKVAQDGLANLDNLIANYV